MKLNIQMFSSTNHTTNYELSQYIGTDKPTYLGDYNSDMSKIDANLKLVSNVADGAASSATSAGTLAQTAKDRADSAYTLADTANTTATTASNTAGTALENTITNATQINKFNLTVSGSSTRETTDGNTVQNTLGKFNPNTHTFTTTSSGISEVSCQIDGMVNSDGSVGKIYGRIKLTANYTMNASNGLPCLRLRCTDFGIAVPETGYTISCAGTCLCSNAFRSADIYVGSDGYLYFYGNVFGSVSSATYFLVFHANLYFFKDFGDIPTPSE